MVKTRKASQFCAVALSAACVATFSQVNAEETVPEGRRHFMWKGTTTSLVDPANWMTDKIWNDALVVEHDWDPKWESYPDGKVYENLLPTASDSVEATSMREAVLGEGEAFHVRDMSIDADGAVAKLTIDKGTFTADGEVVAGQGNRTSEVTLKDGSFIAGNLVLGHWGNAAWGDPAHGILKVEGGTVTTTGAGWAGSLTLGRQDVGAKGELLVSGGTVNVAGGRLSVGFSELTEKIRAASSRVSVSGGVVRVRDELDVGSADKSGGFLEVSGGEVSVGSSLRVGQGVGSVGFVELTGGTVTSGAELRVGAGEGAKAEVLIAGGTLTVASGKDAVIGAAKNVDAHVKVTGGTLASSDSWFCIGRTTPNDEDNDPASNAAVSVLEIDGGTVSHQIAPTPENAYPWLHTTIGSFGSSATRSELILKSGAFTTNHRIFIGEKNPGTLTVSGGTLTAEQIECMPEHGSYRFSGGTFRAAANVGEYFKGDGFGDVITLEGEGIAVAANGFEMVFTKKFAGKVSVVPGDGIVKFKAEDNATCVVAPVVAAPGLVTITAELNSATKADRTADGRYTLVWEDMGDNVYEVTATYDPVKTATWTNASGDSDVANPLNWSVTTASGVTVTAVPETTTAVTVPYAAELPDFSAVEKASLVYTLSGAVAPRGTVTVPQVVTRAIAWYDFNDAATISTGEYGEPTVSNKGAAGAKYDLAYSEWSWNPSYHPEEPLPVYAETQRNGRNVMSFKNSFGFRSKEEMPESEEQSLTLVSVGVRQAQRYPVAEGSDKYNDEFFPVAVEKDYWTEEGPYARIEQWDSNSVNCRVGNYIAEGYQDGEKTLYWKAAFVEARPVLPSDQFAVLSLTCDARELTAKSSIWTKEDGLRQSDPVALNSGSRNTPAGMKISVGERILWRSRSAGELAEVLVFDTAISDEELAEVRAYLQTKWFRAPDPALATIAAEGFVFTGENTSLDLGQVATEFKSVEGAGTIANGDVTITEKVGAGLVVVGSLTLAEGATMDLSALLAQPLNTEVTLLTAAEIVRAPTFVGGENANRKVRILPVTDDAGRIVAYRGTVVSKGFCVLIR